MSAWQQERASTWVKGVLSQVASALPAWLLWLGRGTLGCWCCDSLLAPHSCTPRLRCQLDPGIIQACPKKAGGSRSRVRDSTQTPAQQCCCGCDILLTSSSSQAEQRSQES